MKVSCSVFLRLLPVLFLPLTTFAQSEQLQIRIEKKAGYDQMLAYNNGVIPQTVRVWLNSSSNTASDNGYTNDGPAGGLTEILTELIKLSGKLHMRTRRGPRSLKKT